MIAIVNINYCALVNDRLIQFVIFPERMSLSMAKRLCTVHGGKIATPTTEVENDKLIEIVKKHHDSCIDTKGTEKRKYSLRNSARGTKYMSKRPNI